MTLIVGMKVPDGLVIAADSLVTTQVTKPISIAGSIKCEKCNHEQTAQLEVPLQLPSSISPTAQKLFSLGGRCGVGSWGSGTVNNKSMYNHFKFLDNLFKEKTTGKLSEAVELIKGHFVEQLREDAKRQNIKIPLNVYPFGFNIGGYEADNQDSGAIVTLKIGVEPQLERLNDFGCTVGGDPHIVQKIWAKPLKDGRPMPTPEPVWGLITLQDAIDYSEFLIRTTADYQRFANMIPTVGGPIDIALITTHSGFTWIKHKKLSELLDERVI